jgi:hypothetical protein
MPLRENDSGTAKLHLEEGRDSYLRDPPPLRDPRTEHSTRRPILMATMAVLVVAATAPGIIT